MEEGYIKEKTSIKIPKDEELWIEKITRKLKFNALGKKLFNKPELGPFLYLWFFFFIDNGLMKIFDYIRFGHTFWSVSPISIIASLIGLTFGVWAIVELRNKYYSTIDELKKNDLIKKNSFMPPIMPWHVKVIIYFLGLIMLLSVIWNHASEIVFYPEHIGDFTLSYIGIFHFGWLSGIVYSIIWVAIYLPIIVEFVSIFFGIFLPWIFKSKKVFNKIKFSDPHLFGGLEPIGNLFKLTSSIYFGGLTIYLIQAWLGYWKFGPYSISFFLGGWILGFVLFFIPQISIHNFMKSNKRRIKIEAMTRIQKESSDEFSFLFPRKFKNNKEAFNYIYDYLEFSHADKLKVYPFDMRTLRDLMLTAIIPISAEVFIRIYLHYIGM